MEAMNPGEVVFGGPTLSTAEVPRRESFDLWASIVSEAMVGCSMEPLDDGPFHGSLTPKVTAESMAMLRSMRVQHARELLIAGPDRTISSVARACGFATDRHFYRVFRGETGMTPAEYREYILSRPRHA